MAGLRSRLRSGSNNGCPAPQPAGRAPICLLACLLACSLGGALSELCGVWASIQWPGVDVLVANQVSHWWLWGWDVAVLTDANGTDPTPRLPKPCAHLHCNPNQGNQPCSQSTSCL